jgi:hypothetical protein
MLLQIDALLAQQFVDAARYADAEPYDLAHLAFFGGDLLVMVTVVGVLLPCYQSSRLFQALVQHYQEEGWWPLLNDVLESALVCEQDLANAPGYFTYALQLLPAGSAHLTCHQKAMSALPLLTLSSVPAQR